MTEIYNDDLFLRKMRKHYGAKQFEVIQKAYEYAKDKHALQQRKSGEPYYTHPCHVAEILADYKMDAATVAAGLLHDVLEDTGTTIAQLKAEFGDEIAFLVDGVTKLKELKFQTKEEEQASYIRKMLLAMSTDIRVILIKLADRLHNMRTLGSLPPEKQQYISKETLDIIAPLAARLGINQIKGELEDLAMFYLYPKEYADIVEQLKLKKSARDKLVASVKKELTAKLDEFNIEYEINGRAKHIYSIYRKMNNLGVGIDQIYDLVAIRVIVDSVADCYTVLGVIHPMWSPLPGRFKDYIANPKPNLYQSLHTTVITSYGAPFEIQIRTKDMHRTAEFGIAAHWKYKDGSRDEKYDEKLSKIRKMMEDITQQNEDTHNDTFLDSVKMDILNDEVYVFTPKGDVINLPTGSTLIDFAYSIHSGVGEKCVGGKINMKIAPLSSELHNGDIAEIITSSTSKGPSRDWLNYVKTAGARSKIKQFFKRTMREENIKQGKDMLETAIRRTSYKPQDLLVSAWLLTIAQRYSINSEDDLYAAIGYGDLTTGQVIMKLTDMYETLVKKPLIKLDIETIQQEVKRKKERPSNDILVEGQNDMLIKMSHCCNPVPGDDIVGYISRARGVTIHRANCPNLATLESDRLVKAEWNSVVNKKFSATLVIYAYNKEGVLAAISMMLAEKKLNITSLNAVTDKNDMGIITLTLDLDTIETLENVKNKLKQIKNVVSVSRK